MITIYDIAKVTGYSAPTISKALNGTGDLAEKTRVKIIQAAEEMGYEPNLIARALTTKKSNLIGVIYDDIGMNRGFAHPLFSVVLNRFREQVEAAGFDIIFLSRHFKMSYTSHSKYRSVDGVIIISPASNHDVDLEDLAKAKIPCVSTNNLIPGICSIITENVRGGYEATEYLIKKGHKRIAFLAGPMDPASPAALERFEGYRKALDDYSIPYDETLFEECEYWHNGSGYDSFKKLRERTKDFTAVFATSDMLSFGVMAYAEDHNLKIPEDFSLIGFDDDRAAALCSPKLTTFRHNAIQIADLAAEVLMQKIVELPIPEGVRVPATLIERNSVKNIN